MTRVRRREEGPRPRPGAASEAQDALRAARAEGDLDRSTAAEAAVTDGVPAARDRGQGRPP